jgi:CMP/dCMP kinase
VSKNPTIAIDGPAGAGKSTIAKELAARLGFILVDTGAMYRALALLAERSGLAFEDGVGVAAEGERYLRANRIRFEDNRVFIDDVEVSQEIRTPVMALGASTVSKHPEVRNVLLALQRSAALSGGAVLEGRDIGTVVCPQAEVKFFLTARPEVRARRRFDELTQSGKTVTFESTLADVLARDLQDETRAIAPLKPAADAFVVDSSNWTFEETLAHMASHVREVIQRAGREA